MKLIATTLTITISLLIAAPALAGEINLSVAASLKEVLNELADSFARKRPGVKFNRNYGASGQLAKQIESGGPSDIFISANPEWMNYLTKKNMISRPNIRNFTYNILVFAGTPGRASSLQDLVKLDRIAIGSPRSVPAGQYAIEALQKAGLDKLLAKKLVMAKDVRECLMYAELGEVDGGFVYRTDALQAKKVKILFAVPGNLYPRVAYPMSLTVEGAKNKDAAEFLAYLTGREAKAVLAKYGFAGQ